MDNLKFNIWNTIDLQNPMKQHLRIFSRVRRIILTTSKRYLIRIISERISNSLAFQKIRIFVWFFRQKSGCFEFHRFPSTLCGIRDDMWNKGSARSDVNQLMEIGRRWVSLRKSVALMNDGAKKSGTGARSGLKPKCQGDQRALVRINISTRLGYKYPGQAARPRADPAAGCCLIFPPLRGQM